MRCLTQDLRDLRLTGMPEALDAWHAIPANADRGADACLAFLLDAHRQAVSQSRSDGFFRRAGLATHFSVQTFTAGQASGLTPQRLDHLKGLSWIDRGQTIVISGPTRSGKTHLAAGLGQEAMVQGIRTTFIQTPRMLERCLDPDDAVGSRRYLRQLSAIPLLVMDDFATEQASTERTYLLRRLLDERSRRGLPTVVASINPPGDWDDYFEDPAAREGIYARLLGGECHRVELKRRADLVATHSVRRSTPSNGTRKKASSKEAVAS